MRKMRGAGHRPAVWARAFVAALPLLMGGCTLVPDWADPTDLFAPDEAPATVAQGQAPADGADSFPNLASVPDDTPKTTAPATRAVLRETLAADRANAEYSGQKLMADAGTGAEAAKMPAADGGAMPVPAAAPVPEASAPIQTAQAEAKSKAPDTAAEPAKSAYRFKQFDTNTAARPADAPAQAAVQAPAAGNSELVAVIYFGYGSTALNRNDRDILRDVAMLQKQRGGTVRVIGHASARTGIVDSVRHRLANFETSLQRANAVAAQLVRFGVTRDNVATEAKADSQPVYHEFMPTGEAGNRRAEIFLEN